MGQKIDVTVKGFSVTETFDPTYKNDVPKKYKPLAEKSLSNVDVTPPKGKTASGFAVNITVQITKTDKAVKAVDKVLIFDQDPYSKRDRQFGNASGSGIVATTAPAKDDVEAVVDAALKAAVKTAIGGIQDRASK